MDHDAFDNIETSERAAQLQGHLDADPHNPRLLFEVVDLYLRMGRPGMARPALERLFSQQPAQVATRYLMSALLLQEKRYGESLALSRAMLEAGERHPSLRLQHARTLVCLERFGEAAPVLAGLVAEEADLPQLPHLYIRTLHHLGQFDEAIEFAREHLRRHPADTSVAGMLSLLYLDDDRLVDAALMAEQALDRAPDNLDSIVTLGFVTLAFGEVARADRCFTRAVQLDPGSGRAHLGLALGAVLGGDLAGGRARLERAVECMPSHLGTWNALAWVQLLQDDDEAASRTLQRSLRLDRRFGETYGALAVIAAKQGRWDEAQRLADKAMRLQPDGFAGRFVKGQLLARRGEEEQAQALIGRMLKGQTVPGMGSVDEVMRRFAAASRRRDAPAGGSAPRDRDCMLH